MLAKNSLQHNGAKLTEIRSGNDSDLRGSSRRSIQLAQLNELSYRELQVYAKTLGLNAGGKRSEIESRIAEYRAPAAHPDILSDEWFEGFISEPPAPPATPQPEEEPDADDAAAQHPNAQPLTDKEREIVSEVYEEEVTRLKEEAKNPQDILNMAWQEFRDFLRENFTPSRTWEEEKVQSQLYVVSAVPQYCTHAYQGKLVSRTNGTPIYEMNIWKVQSLFHVIISRTIEKPAPTPDWQEVAKKIQLELTPAAVSESEWCCDAGLGTIYRTTYRIDGEIDPFHLDRLVGKRGKKVGMVFGSQIITVTHDGDGKRLWQSFRDRQLTESQVFEWSCKYVDYPFSGGHWEVILSKWVDDNDTGEYFLSQQQADPRIPQREPDLVNDKGQFWLVDLGEKFPNLTYKLTRLNGGKVTEHFLSSTEYGTSCDCKGFQYRNRCCHTEALTAIGEKVIEALKDRQQLIKKCRKYGLQKLFLQVCPSENLASVPWKELVAENTELEQAIAAILRR
jgi:hypothetical protein